MRKLFLAFVGALALGGSAQAALILHVGDVTATESGSPQTLFVEAWLEETEGTQANVSTYNVGVRLSPTGSITISGHTASVDHPSLFLGQSPTDRTANVPTYTAGNDRLLSDDFVISGNAANAPVQNGTRDGLFRLSLNVPANTLGVFNLNVDPNQLEFADAAADPTAGPLIIDNGVITINAIPEPALLGLGALALPLLGRRRA